jgi:hypothetical protein
MDATIKRIVTLTMILSLLNILIVSPIQGLEKNKLLFPKSMFPQSDAYKTGWATGFLGQPFKGHHTQDYIIGLINGTCTYKLNRSEAPGHTMDFYIGFHNGAIKCYYITPKGRQIFSRFDGLK